MVVQLTAGELLLEERLRKELILAGLTRMREQMRELPEPITLAELILIFAAEAKETTASKKERKVLLLDRIVLLEPIAILTGPTVVLLEATLAIDLHQAVAVLQAHLDLTAAAAQVVLAAVAAEAAPAVQAEAVQAEAAQVEDVNC